MTKRWHDDEDNEDAFRSRDRKRDRSGWRVQRRQDRRAAVQERNAAFEVNDEDER